MADEILMAVLALLGVIGYILLLFGAKEPHYKQGNLFLALYGVSLIIVVVAGLFVNWHSVFSWQDLTSFYAIYGFSACVFLIYFAKGLRLWLPKEEDYYEKRGVKNR